MYSERPDATLISALCATCVDLLGLPAQVTACNRPSGDLYGLGVSNTVMAEIQEFERTLGEDPCVDAWMSGAPVSERDLAHPADPGRWLAFTAAALRVGARASFGYPLQVGTTRLGALNLYSMQPGVVSEAHPETALVLAELTTHIVVSDLTAATPDSLLREVRQIGPNQLEVHQATGMISVQLSITIPNALTRLRAHAYAENRSIGAVAADVVARRLRSKQPEPDHRPGHTTSLSRL